MIKSSTLVLALAVSAAACSSIPDNLNPGAHESLAMIVPARGVQIYECRANKEGAYGWAFVAPEAELFDPARLRRHRQALRRTSLGGGRRQQGYRQASRTGGRARLERDPLAAARRKVGRTGRLLQQNQQHPAREYVGWRSAERRLLAGDGGQAGAHPVHGGLSFLQHEVVESFAGSADGGARDFASPRRRSIWRKDYGTHSSRAAHAA